jgi:tetraacyldisaccharide 4'-kinase
LGLDFVEHSFPDHHAFVPADLDFVGDAIVTTEKDAVKLAALELPLPVWVLPVDARLTPDLGAFLLEKLHGRSPA